MNKCCLVFCLLPAESLLTLPAGTLSVLSITTVCFLAPSFFLATVHLHLSGISHRLTVCLAQILALSPPFFFLFPPHKYSNAQILMLSNAINGKRSCSCFSPTHLNTFFFYLSLHLSMTWWDSSAVWAECLSRIWPQQCCCTADLCVRLSHSLKMWFLCKIWWHYFLPDLCRSLWNHAAMCVWPGKFCCVHREKILMHCELKHKHKHSK